jgi:hypothetical protein
MVSPNVKCCAGVVSFWRAAINPLKALFAAGIIQLLADATHQVGCEQKEERQNTKKGKIALLEGKSGRRPALPEQDRGKGKQKRPCRP